MSRPSSARYGANAPLSGSLPFQLQSDSAAPAASASFPEDTAVFRTAKPTPSVPASEQAAATIRPSPSVPGHMEQFWDAEEVVIPESAHAPRQTPRHSPRPSAHAAAPLSSSSRVNSASRRSSTFAAPASPSASPSHGPAVTLAHTLAPVHPASVHAAPREHDHASLLPQAHASAHHGHIALTTVHVTAASPTSTAPAHVSAAAHAAPAAPDATTGLPRLPSASSTLPFVLGDAPSANGLGLSVSAGGTASLNPVPSSPGGTSTLGETFFSPFAHISGPAVTVLATAVDREPESKAGPTSSGANADAEALRLRNMAAAALKVERAAAARSAAAAAAVANASASPEVVEYDIEVDDGSSTAPTGTVAHAGNDDDDDDGNHAPMALDDFIGGMSPRKHGGDGWHASLQPSASDATGAASAVAAVAEAATVSAREHSATNASLGSFRTAQPVARPSGLTQSLKEQKQLQQQQQQQPLASPSSALSQPEPVDRSPGVAAASAAAASAMGNTGAALSDADAPSLSLDQRISAREHQGDATVRTRVLAHRQALHRHAAALRTRFLAFAPAEHRMIKVYTMTWNMYGRPPPPRAQLELFVQPDCFDVYVFGTEECEQSIQKAMLFASKAKWTALLTELLGDGYVPIAAETMQAIHIIGFVRVELAPFLAHVQTERVPTGFGDVLGNKGGVALSFELGGTSFLFIGSHFQSGEKAVARRNTDFHKINSRLTLLPRAAPRAIDNFSPACRTLVDSGLLVGHRLPAPAAPVTEAAAGGAAAEGGPALAAASADMDAEDTVELAQVRQLQAALLAEAHEQQQQHAKQQQQQQLSLVSQQHSSQLQLQVPRPSSALGSVSSERRTSLSVSGTGAGAGVGVSPARPSVLAAARGSPVAGYATSLLATGVGTAMAASAQRASSYVQSFTSSVRSMYDGAGAAANADSGLDGLASGAASPAADDDGVGGQSGGDENDDDDADSVESFGSGGFAAGVETHRRRSSIGGGGIAQKSPKSKSSSGSGHVAGAAGPGPGAAGAQKQLLDDDDGVCRDTLPGYAGAAAEANAATAAVAAAAAAPTASRPVLMPRAGFSPLPSQLGRAPAVSEGDAGDVVLSNSSLLSNNRHATSRGVKGAPGKAVALEEEMAAVDDDERPLTVASPRSRSATTTDVSAAAVAPVQRPASQSTAPSSSAAAAAVAGLAPPQLPGRPPRSGLLAPPASYVAANSSSVSSDGASPISTAGASPAGSAAAPVTAPPVPARPAGAVLVTSQSRDGAYGYGRLPLPPMRPAAAAAAAAAALAGTGPDSGLCPFTVLQARLSALPLPSLDAVSRFDAVFWMGDLNYRVDASRRNVDHLVSLGMLDECLLHDELRRELHANRVFRGFDEGPIEFPPTYKYDLGCDIYDSSEKMRVPSWTDRILWKKAPDLVLLERYDSCREVRTSDHRPVFAHFLVRIGNVAERDSADAAAELAGAASPQSLRRLGEDSNSVADSVSASGAARPPSAGAGESVPADGNCNPNTVCPTQ